MPIELKIPQISEGVDSATVSEILVSEGDKIEKEDAIITLETDKASADVPASEGGTIKEIKVSEGDEVSVGDVVMILSENDEAEGDDDSKKEETNRESSEGQPDEKAAEQKKKQAEESDSEEDKDDDSVKDQSEESKKDDPEKEEQKNEEKTKKDQKAKEEQKSEDQEKSNEDDSGDEGSKIPASPKVRRLAREKGIDLKEVKGSGTDGRILEEDLEGKESKEPASSKKEDKNEVVNENAVEREELSQIRLTTAKRTQDSWSEIPHVFQFDEADISRVEEFIEEFQEKEEAKLTITSIAIKIVASALVRFPKFNASIDMDKKEVIYKKHINIGVAVDTPKGLLVPVLRNAEQKNLFEIAEEITDLAEKARNGDMTPDEMKGGTFTISNLGGVGGTSFTPIILKPQVAILGLSRAEMKPFFENGEWVAKSVLPLSLSYDHRLIDGAEGAKFISFISKALADPFRAMMGV